MYKILFFGSSDFCLPVLNSLYKNFSLAGVITKSPKFATAVFALKNNISLFTPQNTKDLLNLKDKLADLNPDLAVVADYGLIIPEEIFMLPKFKTINIHFSRLPKYRGPSPVQYSVLFGEKKSYVSVIEMESTVDTGKIIKQIEYPFSPALETTNTLYTKLFTSIAADLPEIIKDFTQNKITPKVQNESELSCTKRINRDDGFITFDNFIEALKKSNIAQTIERKIRAFDPWPGIWTTLPNQKRLKILKAILKNQQLIPQKVQLEGKNPVSWKQFLEGYPQIAELA